MLYAFRALMNYRYGMAYQSIANENTKHITARLDKKKASLIILGVDLSTAASIETADSNKDHRSAAVGRVATKCRYTLCNAYCECGSML